MTRRGTYLGRYPATTLDPSLEPPVRIIPEDAPEWATDYSATQPTICKGCQHPLAAHIPECEWTDGFIHFGDKDTPYPCRSFACECPNYGGRWPE